MHAFDPHHVRPIELAAVATAVGAAPPTAPETVVGVAVDTADVRPGFLFAALPGRHHHGADHVEQARRSGATAVLTDPDGADLARAAGLPLLVVPDVRASLGAVSAAVYGTDTLGSGGVELPLFGVTGTNGKTSTVYLLDALMRSLGWATALTSTAERRVGDTVVPSRLTTPEAPELHAFLARAAEDGVGGIAVEASAQGLSRHRLDGVVFDVAGFTNLTHDHLDDYGDMATYLTAKAALFTPAHARRGIVSVDSPAGRQVVARATVPVTTISALPRERATWRVAVLEQRPDGTRFRLDGPMREPMETEIPLLGNHMAANAGLAIAMLLTSGVDEDTLRRAIGPRIDVLVPGRMADASAPTGPRVFVDFAHTPDAFAKSLEAVRAFTTGRVAIVLGADGDRDPSKRFPMGVVAASGADVVVVADHHPRYEDPEPIRAAILAGARSVRDGDSVVVVEEPDPAAAIRIAIAAVGEDGAVYWAGPGLTDYRDISGHHVPYSSFEDARTALAEAGHPAADRVRVA